jgi:hypothetical protein
MKAPQIAGAKKIVSSKCEQVAAENRPSAVVEFLTDCEKVQRRYNRLFPVHRKTGLALQGLGE